MDIIIKDNLSSYKTSLDHSKNQMLQNATELKRKFTYSQWNDNIHKTAKDVLNDHFDALNDIIGTMESASRELEKIIKMVEEYHSIK